MENQANSDTITPTKDQGQTAVPIDQLSYEEAYLELEEIVNALENNEKTLDEAISLFERGQELIQHCNGLLNHAELKVQQILANELIDFKTVE